MFVLSQCDSKSHNRYVAPEYISIMTLKMVTKINLSADRQQAQFEGQPLSYISIMARKENVKIRQQQGQFIINDDTGSQSFFIHFGGDVDRQIFNILCHEADEPKRQYYIFLFRVRIKQDKIVLDIQSIRRIQDTAQIIYHLSNLMMQRLRLKNKQKQYITQLSKIIEEIPSNKIELSMQENILNFIKAEVNERGNIPLNQQSIVNKFADISTIQEIRSILTDLVQNGLLQQGQGINTFILTDQF